MLFFLKSFLLEKRKLFDPIVKRKMRPLRDYKTLSCDYWEGFLFVHKNWECLLTRLPQLKCIRWVRAFKSPYINVCRVNSNTLKFWVISYTVMLAVSLGRLVLRYICRFIASYIFADISADVSL